MNSDSSMWRHVSDERREIVQFLTGLTSDQWETPSLCSEWRVRDVAAHLLLDDMARETGTLRLLARVAWWRLDVHRLNAWWVQRNADVPVASLINRLNAAIEPGRFARRFGAANQLRAAVIHHEDMRRPLGAVREIPPARLRAVLDVVLTHAGSVNVGSQERASGLRLRATDLDWSYGDGPQVQGPGLSIVLALAGRQVALADLRGEGLDLLRGRMPHALTEREPYR